MKIRILSNKQFCKEFNCESSYISEVLDGCSPGILLNPLKRTKRWIVFEEYPRLRMPDTF